MNLSEDDKRGAIILACVVFFALVVFGVWAYIKYSKPIIGLDNCEYEDKQYIKRKPVAQTVVLVDQSEELSEGHKRFVQKFMLEYVTDDKKFPVGSRIMLFTFSKNDFSADNRTAANGKAPSFSPILDYCRPPSKGNELYENNRKITKKLYQAFLFPFFNKVTEAINQSFEERSPILETLLFISRSQDIVEWPGQSKTLIVVSDMLQHTSMITHYKPPRDYEYFKKRAGGFMTRFPNWDIDLIYLRRYKDRLVQDQPHLDFWQRYFYDSGARLRSVSGVD